MTRSEICSAQCKSYGYEPLTTCALPPATWRPAFRYDSLSRIVSSKNPETGVNFLHLRPQRQCVQKTSPNRIRRIRPRQAPNFCTTSPTASPVKCYTLPPAHRRRQLRPIPTIRVRTGLVAARNDRYCWVGDMDLRFRRTDVSEARVTANVTKNYQLHIQPGRVGKDDYLSSAAKLVNYTYGGAGRVLSVVDPSGPVNYVTSATTLRREDQQPTPNGFVSADLPAYHCRRLQYRLQPVLISSSSPTASVLSLCYDFPLENDISLPPCPTFAASASRR